MAFFRSGVKLIISAKNTKTSVSGGFGTRYRKATISDFDLIKDLTEVLNCLTCL